MKEIIILASNIGNIKNKSNQFILNIIEHFYKSGIRVTVFSKSFSKNFPAYMPHAAIHFYTPPSHMLLPFLYHGTFLWQNLRLYLSY